MICNDCWLIMPTLGPSCSALKGPSALTTTVPPNGQRVCGLGARKATNSSNIWQSLARYPQKTRIHISQNGEGSDQITWQIAIHNSLFLDNIRALWRDFFTIIWCDLGWGCYNLHRKYRIAKFFPTQPRSLRYLISKGRPIDQDAAKFQKEGHVVYGEYRWFFRIRRV